jgi:DNA-binding helix-hairpin-helix protein with protein kinase domain
MLPENFNTAETLPLERSAEQAIVLQRMSQLNQRLLGPWEDADGHLYPRLTMAEAVAQLYEWSTAYREHPELARDFAVMAARLARRLPSAGASRS